MATHQELITSPVVIQAALDHLLPEHRVDLLNVPPQLWNECLAKHLSASTSRKTNFLQVSYRSLSPEAAAGVVSAVVQSYLGFVDGTHKGTASDVLVGLDQGIEQGPHQVQRQAAGAASISSSKSDH